MDYMDINNITLFKNIDQTCDNRKTVTLVPQQRGSNVVV